MLLEGPRGEGPVVYGKLVRPGSGKPAERVQTTPIASIRYAARIIRTRSGSLYRLGRVVDVWRDSAMAGEYPWALEYSALWDRGPADVVDLDAWKELRK